MMVIRRISMCVIRLFAMTATVNGIITVRVAKLVATMATVKEPVVS